MAKERAHIMVISNTGVPLGYIRSVSWTTHKFFMTESKMRQKVTHREEQSRRRLRG